MSRSIRTLESALGVRLFERGQGGVTRPTVFGDLVLARAGAMIRNLDDLVAEVQRVKGLAAGSLSVGAGFFPYDISVGPALVRLARSHPTLHLHAVRSDWRKLVRHVLDGTVDVAVCEVTAAEREASATVERLPERTGSFFVRRDHPLAGAASLSLGQLAPYPFSLTPVPPLAAAAFLQAGVPGRLDTATGDFLPSVTVDSIALMKDIVRETNAFGWAPRCLIRSEPADGEFVPLPAIPAARRW